MMPMNLGSCEGSSIGKLFGHKMSDCNWKTPDGFVDLTTADGKYRKALYWSMRLKLGFGVLQIHI